MSDLIDVADCIIMQQEEADEAARADAPSRATTCAVITQGQAEAGPYVSPADDALDELPVSLLTEASQGIPPVQDEIESLELPHLRMEEAMALKSLLNRLTGSRRCSTCRKWRVLQTSKCPYR